MGHMKKIFYAVIAGIFFFGVMFLYFEPSFGAQEDEIRRIKERARTELNQLPSTNAQEIIGQAIKILTAFMGAIMFVLVVYAGFLWMTAQGNSDKIETAKNIMVWSALGVAVMLTSYIIVQFVFTQIEKGV